jgi:hypothetical protein
MRALEKGDHVHRCLVRLVLLIRLSMTRNAVLVCLALPPLSLLPLLLFPCMPTAMAKFSFRMSHDVLVWFCVVVMLKFLSLARVFLTFPPPIPLPLFALTCPTS